MIQRISRAWKAFRQLGFEAVTLYALYHFGLFSGHYRRSTPVRAETDDGPAPDLDGAPFFPLPGSADLKRIPGFNAAELFAEAGEILAGKYRPFGGPLADLQLTPPAPVRHWTAYERGRLIPGDIKLAWEPGRFGWAYPLVRAYTLSGDERYAAAFWEYAETFLQANPPNLGPQWASGQEVALRLMALAFAARALARAPSSTLERRERLSRAIAAHARRIPLTLVYARAQKNNHLLSEAAGLYTAGVLLGGAPEADAWRKLGWKWLNSAFQAQIAPNGAYTQHSANYHRLMLHLALWVEALSRSRGEALPGATLERLAAATRWLLALLDVESGGVPNLGANDGACILPLAGGGFQDYRPVLQAASRAFLGQPCLPPGPWDELGCWLGQAVAQGAEVAPQEALPASAADMHRLDGQRSWGVLRAAHFSDRPSHADQLHVDLWWRGLNLARDAGTYQYNGQPPWDNRLAGTLVHNTVMVDGQDQMLRGGRFLWLDWAQGRLMERLADPHQGREEVTARHTGYRRLGIVHERTLARDGAERWLVLDQLLAFKNTRNAHTLRVHWLLPDWEWELQSTTLLLHSPYGDVRLRLKSAGLDSRQVQLVRAGETLSGAESPQAVLLGWYSPTYGVKTPALSFSAQVSGGLPLYMTSEWSLP